MLRLRRQNQLAAKEAESPPRPNENGKRGHVRWRGIRTDGFQDLYLQTLNGPGLQGLYLQTLNGPMSARPPQQHDLRCRLHG